jgi:hypothetical protein
LINAVTVEVYSKNHWKVAADTTHVFLLAAMFSFGIVALIFYFRVTAKLQSIGESTPGLFIEPKECIRDLP